MATRCGSEFLVCHVHYWNHFPSNKKPQNERDFQLGFVGVESSLIYVFGRINSKLSWGKSEKLYPLSENPSRSNKNRLWPCSRDILREFIGKFPLSLSLLGNSLYWDFIFRLASLKFFFHLIFARDKAMENVLHHHGAACDKGNFQFPSLSNELCSRFFHLENNCETQNARLMTLARGEASVDGVTRLHGLVEF